MRKLAVLAALLLLSSVPALAGDPGWLHPAADEGAFNPSGNRVYCVTSGTTGTQFCLNNVDGPGVGFNDTTPLSGVGGNTGTTVGQNRINAYMESFRIWSDALTTPETIWIQGTFRPQACNATSGVLGSAGTIQIYANFDDDGGPSWPYTWYHSALANKLSDEDQTSGSPDAGLLAPPYADDIVSFFNGDLGNEGCLEGLAWYYGYDANEGPNDIDFLQVLTHEVNHGLGMANFADEGCIDYTATNASGCQPPGSLPNGWPDIYTVFSWDNFFGLHWNQMNDSIRQYSSIVEGGIGFPLVWDGPTVYAAAPGVLGGAAIVRAGAPLSTDYFVQAATYSPYPPADNSVTAEVVYWNEVDDGTGNPHDACWDRELADCPTGADDVAGKIAMIDRGTCNFNLKSLVAENFCGAVGVIIRNNTSGLPPMGGSDCLAQWGFPCTVPSVGISTADGTGFIGAGIDGTIRSDSTYGLAGADYYGFPKLYTPFPVSPGSSVSHWDTTATPNLLMEPSINSDLDVGSTLDLSVAQLTDIGWDGALHCPVYSDDTAGNVMIGACDTGVDNAFGPWSLPGGLAGPKGKGWKTVGSTTNGGCYIADMTRSCMYIATNQGDFNSCIAGVANGLRKIGAISKAESDSMKACSSDNFAP